MVVIFPLHHQHSTTLTITIERDGTKSFCRAVVDHRYLFTDINVGWPGSVHDARVLANSSLFEKAEEGLIFGGQEREIEAYR